jgi:putative aldouronate transport system permease protein
MVTVRFSRMDRGDKTFTLIVYILLTLLTVVVLYPLLFVLAASFSDPDLVLKGEVTIFPKGFTLKPYSMVFENEDIWRGYLNTIVYTVVGTLINVAMTILLAYPLSRPDMPLKKPITLMIIFTMYFDGGMIPS